MLFAQEFQAQSARVYLTYSDITGPPVLLFRGVNMTHTETQKWKTSATYIVLLASIQIHDSWIGFPLLHGTHRSRRMQSSWSLGTIDSDNFMGFPFQVLVVKSWVIIQRFPKRLGELLEVKTANLRFELLCFARAEFGRCNVAIIGCGPVATPAESEGHYGRPTHCFNVNFCVCVPLRQLQNLHRTSMISSLTSWKWRK